MYETDRCLWCGKTSLIVIDDEGYKKWQEGELIQYAFPAMSAADREMLKTGTHPECWSEITKEPEE